MEIKVDCFCLLSLFAMTCKKKNNNKISIKSEKTIVSLMKDNENESNENLK